VPLVLLSETSPLIEPIWTVLDLGEDGLTAGKGYDLTTGWGTPNVSQLISTFVQNQQ